MADVVTLKKPAKVIHAVVPGAQHGESGLAPEKFGAIPNLSDATTAAANRLALKAALDSGYPIRGGKRRFYVAGRIEPATYCDIEGVRLVQTTPGISDCRTLHVNGPAVWNIRDVEIDMGGLFTGGNMNDTAGIRINTGKGVLRDCTVFNGGACSAIAILNASRVELSGNHVRDMQWNLSGITDDVFQGIWLYQVLKVIAEKNRIYNLTAINNGVATRRYSRGFSVSGCADFNVSKNEIEGVDQGIDMSGSPGNRHGVVTENILKNLGTYGIKVANTAADLTISENIIKYAGFVGIVLSPQASAPTAPAIQTQHIRVKGNQIYRTGSFDNAVTPEANSDWSAFITKSGIRVLSNAFDPTYPRNVLIEGNDIVDDQGRMNFGASSEVALSNSVSVGNSVVGRNFISGAVSADYSGFAVPFVHVRNSNTVSLANDTWTTVLFDTEVYDAALNHSASVNTERVEITTSGLYLIEGSCEFAVSATGRRVMRFLQGGSLLAATTRSETLGSTQGAIEMSHNATARLSAGNYVTMQINQVSGGALDSDARNLKVTLLHEGA